VKRPDVPGTLRKLVRRRPKDEVAQTASDPVDKLKGQDRIGLSGRLLATAGGAVGGGFVGAGLGASTVTIGSVVLGFASPVGWVIGGVALGGLGAYAVGKAVHSGGKSDQIRADFLRRYAAAKTKVTAKKTAGAHAADLEALIAAAVERGALAGPMADRIRAAVASGKMSHAVAMSRVKDVLAGAGGSSQVPRDP